jgi:hypothetical protein
MKILEVAAARFRVEERDVTLEDIRRAKEAFIASTTNHVRPVSHVDGHPVGQETSAAGASANGPSGAAGAPAPPVPGPISQWLNEQIYRLVVSHP